MTLSRRHNDSIDLIHRIVLANFPAFAVELFPCYAFEEILNVGQRFIFFIFPSMYRAPEKVRAAR
jgi:hypothetical protein